jgi:hypothetical protein
MTFNVVKKFNWTIFNTWDSVFHIVSDHVLNPPNSMFRFANTNLTSLCYMLLVKQLTCQYEHAHCVNVMHRQFSLQQLPPCIVCAIAAPYVSPFSCHLLHEPTSIAWVEYNLCPTIYSYLQTPTT